MPLKGILKKPGDDTRGIAKTPAKVSWNIPSASAPDAPEPGSSWATEAVEEVSRTALRKASGKARAHEEPASKAMSRDSGKVSPGAPAKGPTKASAKETGTGKTRN